MYNLYNFHQLAVFLEGKKAVAVRHFSKGKERKCRTISANSPSIDFEQQATTQQCPQRLTSTGLRIILSWE